MISFASIKKKKLLEYLFLLVIAIVWNFINSNVLYKIIKDSNNTK